MSSRCSNRAEASRNARSGANDAPAPGAPQAGAAGNAEETIGAMMAMAPGLHPDHRGMHSANADLMLQERMRKTAGVGIGAVGDHRPRNPLGVGNATGHHQEEREERTTQQIA